MTTFIVRASGHNNHGYSTLMEAITQCDLIELITGRRPSIQIVTS